MVLMAAVENDHRRGAKVTSAPSNSTSTVGPAPRPSSSSSRARLHDFSFPTLSWGTHRVLRCAKNYGLASSPAPASPETTPSPDKAENPHRPEGGGAGGSLQRQRAAQRPWNLRTRRSATAAPARRQAGSDEEAAQASAERAPAPTAEAKKRALFSFSVALSKQEIAEDFAAIRGTRPPRRPKKRPRTVQRQLDLLYPGLCLVDVAPGSYKIEER